MSFLGWFLASLVALIITVVFTGIVVVASGMLNEDRAILNSIFAFLTSGITSVFAVLIFGYRFSNHTARIIFAFYGVLILFLFIQLLLQYIFDEILGMDEGIVSLISIILYIVFSVSLIVFGSVFISKNKVKISQIAEETRIEKEYKASEKQKAREIAREIRAQKSAKRREAFVIFYNNNKILVIVSSCALVILIILSVVITSVQRKKKIKMQIEREKKDRLEAIHNVAEVIINEIGDFDAIENAQRYVMEYNQEIRKYNSEISKYKKMSKDDLADTNILRSFGRKSRLENYSKWASNARKDKNKFEINHKEKFNECEALLSKYGKEFIDVYNAYKVEIRQEMENIKSNAEREIEENRQRQYNSAIEKQNEKSRENKASAENEQRQNDCADAVRHLKEETSNIQKFISSGNEIQFQHLEVVEGHLDKILNLKDAISNSDIIALERCEKKLLYFLDKQADDDNLKIDIDIIKDIFKEILNEKKIKQ